MSHTENKTAAIYARVSSTTDRQNTERQVIDLKAYADRSGLSLVKVYEEHISGAKRNAERPVLMDCIEYCKGNHVGTLLVSELSRLGRNTFEVLATVRDLVDCHINVYFQKEQMGLYLEDGSENPFLAIFISVISTCASIERDSIKFRLNDARAKKIAEAKASGLTLAQAGFGRPCGAVKTKEKKEAEYAKVLKSLKQGKSIRDTAKLCDVSISTVKRLKKEFNL